MYMGHNYDYHVSNFMLPDTLNSATYFIKTDKPIFNQEIFTVVGYSGGRGISSTLKDRFPIIDSGRLMLKVTCE